MSTTEKLIEMMSGPDPDCAALAGLWDVHQLDLAAAKKVGDFILERWDKLNCTGELTGLMVCEPEKK